LNDSFVINYNMYGEIQIMEFMAFMADWDDLNSQVNTFLEESGPIKIKNSQLTSTGEKNDVGFPVLALTLFYEK
jgi:hypothetical protein